MSDRINPEQEGLDIVLAGSFNPAIFQPAWFAAQGLIPPHEAEKAKIEVISGEISVFSLGWCALNVEQEKFLIDCTQPPYYEATRDLILGAFRVLKHTPAKGVAMIHTAHFK